MARPRPAGDPGRGAAASLGPRSGPPASPGPGRPAPPSRLPLPSRREQKTRHKEAAVGPGVGSARLRPLGFFQAPHTSWSPQRRRGGNAGARGGRRTFHSSLQWNRLAIIGRSQAQTSSAALVGSLHKSAVWLDRKWLRRNQSQRGAPLPEAGLPSLRAASCPPPSPRGRLFPLKDPLPPLPAISRENTAGGLSGNGVALTSALYTPEGSCRLPRLSNQAERSNVAVSFSSAFFFFGTLSPPFFFF